MNWFSWLSRTNLDPSLTYEYALAFAQNELEQDDITYFNHEFLQSMGISTAKHRLEILKLATAEKRNRRAIVKPVSWFKFAIKQTKTYLTKKIDTLVHHHRRRQENSIMTSLVPGAVRNHSLRWKVSMLQRNNRVRTTLAKPYWLDSPPRFVSTNNEIVMLKNGSPGPSSGSSPSSDWAESEANPESANPGNSSFSRTTVRSASSTEEIKWDSMFKNLKPT
ncbi:hypothetical protein CASFOL_038705 [Castilleja foliolosa]|uniref:SAM domain-containing protein n=1 Tax=Castilleja foliolosa TaxID=1961234 RepID=A0ABD3BMM5_9LAMI